MAIDDLPMPVVNFLNVIGIEWPYINEDALHHFADLAREFGQAVEQTHQDATQAVSNIAQAYQGASTRAMSSGWAHLSSTHVHEVTEACSILADALDAWAVYVVVQKGEALVQLVEMAVEFFADQAASVATLGIAEAALPLIIETGQKLGQSLIQDLEQYVIGEVIEVASKPLVAKVEAMLAGLDWSNAPGGVDPLGSQSLQVDVGLVEQHANLLRSHAQTMRSHAANFHAQAAGIEF